MNTAYFITLMLTLLSGFSMLAGLYVLMGLCCQKSKLSKVLGGSLGLVGLTGVLFTILPSC